MAAARRPYIETLEEDLEGIELNDNHSVSKPLCRTHTVHGQGNFGLIKSEGHVTINQDIRSYHRPVYVNPDAETGKLHEKLKAELEQNVTPKQLDALVSFLKGTNRVGEMRNINTFGDLWKELSQRGEISPDRYDILERGFSSMQEAGHLQIIKDFKEQMKSEDGRYKGWLHDETVMTSIDDFTELKQDYLSFLKKNPRRGVLFTNAALSNIGKEGGKIRLTNGSVELEVPPGAVDMKHEFWLYATFTHGALILDLNVRDAQFPLKPENEDVTNSDGMVKYSIPVRLGPSGVDFTCPVRLTLKDLSKPPSINGPSNALQVYRKADGDTDWKCAGSCFYDTGSNDKTTACIALNSFSSFVLGMPVLSDTWSLNVRVMAQNKSVNTTAEGAKKELEVLFTINDYSFSKEFIIHNRKNIKSATCLYLDPKSDVHITWARRHLLDKASVKVIQQGVLDQREIHNLAEMPVSLSLAAEDDQQTKEPNSSYEDVLILEQSGTELAELHLGTNEVMTTEQKDSAHEIDQETPDVVGSVTSNTQTEESLQGDTISTQEQPTTLTTYDHTPPKPNKPEAVAISSNSLQLCWTVQGNTEHVTNYILSYRKTDGNGCWLTVAENSGRRFTIEDLEAETWYEFRVASNTKYGQSPPSEVTEAKTSKDSIAEQTPPQPKKPKVKGTPAHNNVTLEWDVPGNTTHVTHYTISYRPSVARGHWMCVETEDKGNSFTIEYLQSETSYEFRVASNTQTGQSPQSEKSDIITTQEQSNIQSTHTLIPPKPNKPNAVAIKGRSSILICWTTQGNTEHITNYILGYRKTKAKVWMTVETDDFDCRYTMEYLEPATSYEFRVASNTKYGRSPPSEVTEAKTNKDLHIANQIPPMPKKPKVKGTPAHNNVTLEWDVPGNTTHVTHYTISYRPSVARGHWMCVETEDKGNSFTIEYLQPETSYEFRVASNTDQGQSPPGEISDTIDTACKKLAAGKPCKLKCSSPPTYNSLTLSWEVEGVISADIQDFTIFYQAVDNQHSDVDGLKTKLKTENPQTLFTIRCLEPNTKYQIWIEANTKDGQQHCSKFGEFFTTAELPKSLKLKSKPAPPIPPPGSPRLAPGQKPTQHTIPIVWEADTERFSITHFVLAYRASTSEGWIEIEIPGSKCEYTLKGLREGTDYVLHVQAHSQTGSSVRSEDSRIATEFRSAGQIAREELKKQSKLIQSYQGMDIYQAPLIMTKNQVRDKIRMLDLGKRSALLKPEKIILMVGATGTGKSTLINGLLNYVVGVEWADKFRFRLVEESASFDSQHKSQTQSITIYTLHHQDTYSIPYTLKVIDTPGFGDTEGISKDKLITDYIRNLFSNIDYGVDHIDAIGVVAQSSLPRLTLTQNYIFDNILSLFGKDIGDNIFLLLTFSDNQMPPILAGAREAKIPFKSYFKFNNSALFARNDSKDDEFYQLFWKMGVRNFQKFLGELENMEGKSLVLTKEVLEERQRLEMRVARIQKDIYNGLTKLEQFRVEIDVVRQHESDIEKNKNFNYTVDEHKMVKVDLEPGKHVTNCLTCNITCHYPCTIPKDEDKVGCSAMDRSGNCMVCPENCHWSLHHNVPFRIEVETVQVTRTTDELKKRYERAKGEKMNAEKLTQHILDDFYNIEMKVLYVTNEVRRSLARLSEIALRPNPLSTVEYVDILIKSEISEARPGFQARIDQLETVKEQAQVLSKMADEGYDPFEDYRETLKLAKTRAHQCRLERVKEQAKVLSEKAGTGYDPFKEYRKTETETLFEDIVAEIRKKFPSFFSIIKKFIEGTKPR